MHIEIPELERHCNSWVVSRIADGSVIGEFFYDQKHTILRFNPATCRVETYLQYLARIRRNEPLGRGKL